MCQRRLYAGCLTTQRMLIIESPVESSQQGSGELVAAKPECAGKAEVDCGGEGDSARRGVNTRPGDGSEVVLIPLATPLDVFDPTLYGGEVVQTFKALAHFGIPVAGHWSGSVLPSHGERGQTITQPAQSPCSSREQHPAISAAANMQWGLNSAATLVSYPSPIIPAVSWTCSWDVLRLIGRLSCPIIDQCFFS